MHSIGIDIGGTKIAGALVDELGGIIREHRVPTPKDAKGIEDAVVEMITVLGEGAEPVGAGVAAAGFIDALSPPSITRPTSTGAASRSASI